MRFFCIILAITLASAAGLPSAVKAQDTPENAAKRDASNAAVNETKSKRRVIVKDIPQVTGIRRVSGANTHSGFQVPRYVSLKFGQVNGRQGPSLRHPKRWQYQRRGLPLVVVAEMDIWRKVRDMYGDESWVRTQALSGTRHVIALEDAVLHAKPKAGTRTKAIANRDTLLELIECDKNNWCRVKSKSGHKGWTERRKLWGAEPL